MRNTVNTWKGEAWKGIPILILSDNVHNSDCIVSRTILDLGQQIVFLQEDSPSRLNWILQDPWIRPNKHFPSTLFCKNGNPISFLPYSVLPHGPQGLFEDVIKQSKGENRYCIWWILILIFMLKAGNEPETSHSLTDYLDRATNGSPTLFWR